MKISANSVSTSLMRSAAIACLCVLAAAAIAQPPGDPQNKGYSVGESTQPGDTPATAPANSVARMARLHYVNGNVTWRPDANSDWKPAKQNIAINSGAQIWAVGEGKAEIRFDDGAVVRFGHGAVAVIDTMYSDKQGGFTHISLNSGLGFLVLKSERNVYQADLPTATVIASGPSRIRIGADHGAQAAVRAGKAVLQGKQAKPVKLNMRAGDFASTPNTEAAISLSRLPPPDGWDRWNDERDHVPTGYHHSGPYGPVFVPLIIEGGWRHH